MVKFPAIDRRVFLACGITVSVTLLSALSACAPSLPTAPTAPVAAVRLHYTAATTDLNIAGSATLRAFAIDADSVYSDVTPQVAWFSSDPVVAQTAGTSNVVRALSAGTAVITGQYRGLADSVRLVVRPFGQPPFPYLDLQAMGDPRAVGRRSQGVLMLRESATSTRPVADAAAWTSSDSRVATVERGLVTAVAPGTVEITATYQGLSVRYGLSIAPRQQ